jgi:hypothetical protein
MSLPVPLPIGSTIQLERRTYPSNHGELLGVADGLALVLVESGELRFAPNRLDGGTAWHVARYAPGTPATPRSVPPGSSATLRSGETLLVDGGVGDFSNVGTQTAVTLVLSATSPDGAPGRFDRAWPATVQSTPAASPAIAPGRLVTATPLISGITINLPTADVAVTIGRAVLPTGGVPAHTVDGAELIAVEAGSLVLVTEGDAAWVHLENSRATALLPNALLSPGDGALVHRHSRVRYASAADTPLELLVVTISPANSVADPSPAH